MQRYESLEKVVKYAGAKKIAEIGVDKGQTTRHIIETCAPELYILVDIVRDPDLTEFIKSYPHIHYHIMPSVEAAKLVDERSFCLVFIDADHTYQAVKDDIAAWMPKVKVGGVLCGHDYGRPKWQVTPAVDEMFGKDVILHPENSIWEIIVKCKL